MKSLSALFLALFLFSCSSNTVRNENCNFLLDLNINLNINLSLPEYSQLNFVANSIYIQNIGNAGIIVANTGSSFMAWDASDPNYVPGTCSHLVPNGLFCESECGDGNEYNLLTGEINNSDDPTLVCALKNYRVQQSGNILTIYN
ncbi:hypothetical protein PK35_13260 [Tamlana nanhaiensis]|uniref:Rieske domain-containing protein n=1 Tax=Neotamlana nanhaiensis TaxID=1382798 RepID=A0A0D7W1I8_9FLAO|nr:hypothetical protein [Tamlana nanhaiensis]KJD31717.1 hypothetical protein PK35_13260 [Tamlana nanhaiensis]